jgi:hypothetical protein
MNTPSNPKTTLIFSELLRPDIAVRESSRPNMDEPTP